MQFSISFCIKWKYISYKIVSLEIVLSTFLNIFSFQQSFKICSRSFQRSISKYFLKYRFIYIFEFLIILSTYPIHKINSRKRTYKYPNERKRLRISWTHHVWISMWISYSFAHLINDLCIIVACNNFSNWKSRTENFASFCWWNKIMYLSLEFSTDMCLHATYHQINMNQLNTSLNLD